MNAETRAKIRQWISKKQVQVVELPVPTPQQIQTQSSEVVTQSPEVVTQPMEVAESRPVLREELILGNNLEILKQFPDNTFTAIVTDPPYFLSFMGKKWDSAPEDVDNKIAAQMSYFQEWSKAWAKEALRVLKPGGHLLSFGGTRTSHRMVCGIEDAGFQIRDKISYFCELQAEISWMYGSGFPKSLNIGKQFEKNGDMENAEKFSGYGSALKPAVEPIAVFGKDSSPLNPDVPFKYEAKASGKERNRGCEDLFWLVDTNGKTYAIPKEDYDRMADENEARKEEVGFEKHKISQGNIHCTVKPLDLMRYLVRMVKMPGDNLILDPFAGSGTTLVACVLEGCDFVGIEMDESSIRIAQHRVSYAKKNGEDGYK